MTDTRRKILFNNINPAKNDADKFFCDMLADIPQRDRGRILRTLVLAGAALRKLDPRLPAVLSEVLNEHSTEDDLMTGMKAVCPELFAAVPKTAQPEPHSPDDETRDNMKSMFGKPS